MFVYAYGTIIYVNKKGYKMFGLGQAEIVVILLVVLLLFGSSRLPKVSRTLGDSAKSFRDGFTGGKNDKSIKEITQEVTSSAKEIKKNIVEVKQTATSADPANPGEGGA